MQITKISGLIAVGALLALPGTAQNLSLPATGNDGTRVAGAELPGRGMSMADVESRFGTPARRRAAVGDPPITRWEYDGFIVYFEYKHVIHSVRRR